MRGLERLARWLGLGSTSSFESTTLPMKDQSDKLLGKNSQGPPRSRPCLSPSRRGLVLSFLFVALSLTFSVLMWCTDIYDQSVLKLVSIRNDLDMIFDLWRFPPTRPYLNVYIFNYTNPYSIGYNQLPRVDEVGPYVFQETTEKINIQFHDNGTVSFQENKTIHFVPERSFGTLNDTIIVPNIPVLAIISFMRNLDLLPQAALSKLLLPALGTENFQKILVNDFIWGYEDNFHSFARSLQNIFNDQKDINKFGFLVKRRGVGHHVLTVNTGSYDLDSVANIEQFDGQNRIGQWGNTPCDVIEGHEGGLFPGNRIRRKEPQNLYVHDMCRKLPLVFNRTTESVDGFPVNEYVFPEDMFDYSPRVKSNQCYHQKNIYPPKGTFYSGPCNSERPVYTTLPHFLNGDEKLQKSIEGLRPDPAKHTSSFLIHEKLGVTLRAQSKFQLNIRYNEAKFINQFKGLEDGTILPIAWLHIDSGPLPEHFINIVYHLTYTTRFIELSLKWFFLVSLFASIFWMYRQIKRNHILFRL